MNFLCTGELMHTREVPKRHQFGYQAFMVYFDIAEADTFLQGLPFCGYEKFAWLSLWRKNHYCERDETLDASIRLFIKGRTGLSPAGKIFLLTQLACLGFCFNPISIYVVYKKESAEIDMLVLEVTNTPWGECHRYLLHTPVSVRQDVYTYHFKKNLHVSPFMAMDYDYKLTMKIVTGRIHFYMESLRQEKKHFSASLALQTAALNKANLRQVLWRFPLTQFKVSLGIYWQALRLWLKGLKIYTHPKNIRTEEHE
jgi:DUF1365 family protein